MFRCYQCWKIMFYICTQENYTLNIHTNCYILNLRWSYEVQTHTCCKLYDYFIELILTSRWMTFKLQDFNYARLKGLRLQCFFSVRGQRGYIFYNILKGKTRIAQVSPGTRKLFSMVGYFTELQLRRPIILTYLLMMCIYT